MSEGVWMGLEIGLVAGLLAGWDSFPFAVK